MSRPPITLSPQRCDKCMRCVRACDERAITVSAAFTFIDWDRCDGCGACVRVCEPGAISWRGGRGAAETDAHVAARERLVAEVDAAVRAERAAAKPAASSATPLPAPTQREPLSLTPFTARWDGWEVAAVLLGVAVLYAAQMAVLSSGWWAKVVPLGAKPLMRAGILTLCYAAQLGLLAALGYRKRAGIAEAFGLKRTSASRAMVWVLGLVAATEMFTVVYGMVTQGIGWQMPPGPATNLGAYFGRDSLGLTLTVVMVVIIGPFFEEAVFRGVLLGYLVDRIGPWPAIVASALLFSAYHVSLWEFVPLATMGVAAGWLAVRRRSLWPAYALHLAYNAVPVIVAFALAK